ncbi:MAG: tetratricopeptide repeat protein [Alphaproteobacteria bacterium]
MLRKTILGLGLALILTGCVTQERTTTGAGAAQPATQGQMVTANAQDERSKKLYLDLIGQLIAEGKLNAALAHLDEYRLRVVGDPVADLMRADVLARLGRLNEAAAAVAPFVRRERGGDNKAIQAKANKIAGRISAGRGKWGNAVVYFERSRSLTPSDPSILNNLGFALAQTGDYARAQQLLRQAMDLAPGSPQIRNNLIVAYYHGKKRKTAKAMFDQLGAVEKKAVAAMIKAWPDAPDLQNL